MIQMTILFLLALTGCASNVALKDAAGTPRAVGTLSAWGPTHKMEVMLDGKRYEGVSVRNPCTTDACYGIYRNDTLGLHRGHTSKESKATLESADGDQGPTLPFLSYGGSGIVANCVAVAVLLRIDWEHRQMMRGKTF